MKLYWTKLSSEQEATLSSEQEAKGELASELDTAKEALSIERAARQMLEESNGQRDKRISDLRTIINNATRTRLGEKKHCFLFYFTSFY
jgi:hypothetical protein